MRDNTPNIETAIRITAKLYAARDAMQKLFGKEYPAKIAEYQDIIREVMKKYSCDETRATMLALTFLKEQQFDNGMVQALICAAFVEMVEPSAIRS